MIEETFIHAPNIGALTEASLWKQGCLTWGHFLQAPASYTMGSCDAAAFHRCIEESVEAKASGRHQYFAKALASKHHWRALPDFRDKIVYLDIETDGGQSGESITCIGLYDGSEFVCLTRDEGLGAFPDLISKASMIVTFWGTGFDLPMLQKKFTGLKFDQLHLDLCYAFRQVGIRGGLKAIERQLGIARVEEAAGLTGRDAIWLWNRWERYDDEEARDTLIAYNREDVVNMEFLAKVAFEKLRAQLRPEESVSAS